MKVFLLESQLDGTHPKNPEEVTSLDKPIPVGNLTVQVTARPPRGLNVSIQNIDVLRNDSIKISRVSRPTTSREVLSNSRWLIKNFLEIGDATTETIKLKPGDAVLIKTRTLDKKISLDII